MRSVCLISPDTIRASPVGAHHLTVHLVIRRQALLTGLTLRAWRILSHRRPGLRATLNDMHTFAAVYMVCRYHTPPIVVCDLFQLPK